MVNIQGRILSIENLLCKCVGPRDANTSKTPTSKTPDKYGEIVWTICSDIYP